MRYRNAPAAIEWLCTVFGFEKNLVVDGPNNSILHAQLSFGNGMIMLGSIPDKETQYSKLMKHPDEVRGAQTQSVYLVVSDADAVHVRARAEGAKIAIEIKDEEHGGRSFSCFDLEGYLWTVGTYDPWRTPDK